MRKIRTKKPATGKNQPSRNSLDVSWLPIIEDVHRQLPELRKWFKARRCPQRAHHGPRKKRG
jgi:hypothetical protein